ncbi:hypothetical protein WICPIJ_007280 [Wickerhamomyces pijperi]|uniref:Uncharacterized protein n=1 Tax=Wickerhamomyces pijperi TaxID=599730 RepID=A0A9P8Q263_WICPI|nr:hypothetical protein WICPIJ_007280 [Wickerhamomyces pijperi]
MILALKGAGFNSGPKTLKMVGMLILVLIGATFFMAGWKFGANKKTNLEILSNSGVIVISTLERSTPNSVNKSPAPEAEVDALPPCLQTSIPIPAATMADDVETLNVF